MLRRGDLLSGVVLMLAVSVTSVASAQAPRGGRGGFGGPGGGMRSSGVMLLNIAEVQKELAITDAQKKQVEELLKEVQEQTRGAFGRGGGAKDESREDRKKRFEEQRAKLEEASKKSEEKLAKILDAKQMERWNQLKLQRDGAASLSQPEIAKQLGLSEEQLKKIRDIQEAARPGRGGSGGPDGDPQDFLKKIREARDKAQTDTLAVLTSEQKTKWTAMQGKEFKFPESADRAGGGGSGGPRGGGGSNEEKKRPERKKDV